MRLSYFRVFPFCSVFSLIAAAAFADILPMNGSSARPRGLPSMSASPVPSLPPESAAAGVEAVVVPSLESQPSIAPTEAARLRRDFSRTLRDRLFALDASHKRVRRETDAARKVRFDEWSKQETAARRQFFAENPKGADRRVYMKDLIARRKRQLELNSAEEKREAEDQRIRRKAIEQEHADRLQEFERYLKAGRRPPESMWLP